MLAVGDDRVRLVQMRWLHRLPRVALLIAAASLSLAGLNELLSRPTAAEAPPTPSVGPSDAAKGIAETFARLYLSRRRGDETHRIHELTLLGLPADAVEAGADSNDDALVRWTAIAGVTRNSSRSALITVVADRSDGLTYLAVPVSRTRTGGWAVRQLPAIVGAPEPAKPEEPPDGMELDDPALEATVDRAARHYIEGEENDLQPDLAPGAAPRVPEQRLRVARLDAATWVVPRRRVAVIAQVRDAAGASLQLRYELGVVRVAGRWLVRDIQNQPNQQRGTS